MKNHARQTHTFLIGSFSFSVNNSQAAYPFSFSVNNPQAADWIWKALVGGFCLMWLFIVSVAGFLFFKYFSVLTLLASQRLRISTPFLLAIFSSLFLSSVRPGIANIPLYKIKPKIYLGINLIGGIIPIAIALYQVRHVPLIALTIVSAIVATLSYFSTLAGPTIGVRTTTRCVWLIAILAALSAELCVAPSVERLDVSVAFSGSVIGFLVGGDLLHLRDMKIREYANKAHMLNEEMAQADKLGGIKFRFYLGYNLGGRGGQDAIVGIGIASLLIAEWYPFAIDFISTQLGFERQGIVYGLVGIVLTLLIFDIKKIRGVPNHVNRRSEIYVNR